MTMETTETFRRATETGDVELAMSTMSEDVVLRSPLTDRGRFAGREDVRAVFEAALSSIEDIRFHTDIGDDRQRALFYRGRVGRTAIEECSLVRLDDQARIVELTMWMRPLPGITAVMGALGPKIARSFGKPKLAVLLSVLTKPLQVMVGSGDRLAARVLKR
ncbi:nuclear transport factor 2 family protein [Allokutzneria sp. A3M-2-11 16]|uniref:nuclear transport factor 2 family protein n=1 Tax=Allokutzneria sp. A3M-2-11 16 TaxID=2962043 RepID=UPI0020B828E0|nr:nuclear transport factor 2 family protein [Allokutzneria sp. A3M-2-11 16]MCP3799276.1 nuclear transport factor 2 family protein [Allokutzneria sp. A3M-2-11 16]